MSAPSASEPTSPRIAAFHDALASGISDAREILGHDLSLARGPLVEELPDDSDHVLVTYVWFGDEGPVSLRAELPGADGFSHALTHVPKTDVWYRTVRMANHIRITYQFVIDDYMTEITDWGFFMDVDEVMRLESEVEERTFADPLNPDSLPVMGTEPGSELLPSERWPSILSLPGSPKLEFYDDDAPAGELTTFRLRSEIFGNERDIVVYAPPNDAKPEALLVMLDGDWWVRIAELNLALDSLQARQLIPPTLAVFIDNVTPTSRWHEMPCNPQLPEMIASEVLPVVHANYNLDVPAERSVIGGASYGGLGCTYIAFERPDLFGNVLSSSAAFWWGLANDPNDKFRFGVDGEPEWLARQYAQAERKPLRFWLDVSSLETGPIPNAPGLTMVAVNRHMRTVLQAKGYEVSYYETAGGHDFAAWKLTAPMGLQALLARYAASA